MDKIGLYLNKVKYFSIQSWPCGVLSFMLMVSSTRNLTALARTNSSIEIGERQRAVWIASTEILCSEQWNA